jgi:AraC-like DNA-binding protein
MYRLRTPAEPLRNHIENYWFVEPEADGAVDLRVEVFVDARADLIFNFGAPYRREVIGGGASQLEHANFDAQRLVPIRIHQHGAVRIVGVRFRLGGVSPFTRARLAEWSGQTPPPAALFGESALLLDRALRQADDIEECAALLDAFFLQHQRRDERQDAFERALAELVASEGTTTVGRLAESAACSPRQIERLFAQSLGLPPKVVGRVLRFQHALRRLMHDPQVALADVAADARYYDQAHFIREFRLFTGGVPRGYRGYYPPQGPADFAPNVVVFVQDTEPPAR